MEASYCVAKFTGSGKHRARNVISRSVLVSFGIVVSYMKEIVDLYNSNIESFMPKEMFLIIISAVPFIELRGGMIVASLLEIPYLKAAFLCFFGNILPIPFILLLGRKLLFILKDFHLTSIYAIRFEKKMLSKSTIIKKYEFIGLSIFVGIPLPGSGVWSGSLIAALLNFSLKRAIFAQSIGMIMGILIMSLLTYALPSLLS